MDKGAHFHNCDFQVHTPRDLQWRGKQPISDKERDTFADAFVRACRSKGVDAVAITDHHDLAFVPYIRRAASRELDEHGQQYSIPNRLTVFPGIELTLGVPCQALLLFDADFPDDLFDLVYNSLGIIPAPKSAPTTAEVKRLEAVRDLNELYVLLDNHSYLRGRYIVLPNVSDGGNTTLLRSAFHAHYRNMPCIGGYTDKGVDKLGDGNRAILAGRNPDWGSKSLGVFQTSDARSEDFAELGSHTTWVKWAVPTAEALRQACLAKQSRLSHMRPSLPPSILTSVGVSNSRFLGPLTLDFNPQYNAIIGGRGTGKSTILEYLRWALCDEIPNVTDDDEATDHAAKRERLIERTLTPYQANVQVSFLKNNVPHIVRRFAADRRLLLKIGNGEFEPTTEEQLRAILPIQAYSQKQLSSVGVRLDQLQRFVEAPVRAELDDLDRQRERLLGEIREQYGRLVRKRQSSDERERLVREARSITEQVEATRLNLRGISPDDQIIISQKPAIDEQADLLDRWQREISTSIAAIKELRGSLNARPTLPGEKLRASPRFEQIQRAETLLTEAFAQVGQALSRSEEVLSALDQPESSFAEEIGDLRAFQADYEQRYQEAKGRSSAHESVLQQLDSLETRARQLRNDIAQLDEAIRAMGAPEADFPERLRQWTQTHITAANLVSAQCLALTKLSDNLIRATLRRHVGFDKPMEALQVLLRGTNIRTNKLENLIGSITATNDPLARWDQVCQELEQLALLQKPIPAAAALPECPLLGAHFNSADIARLAGKITPEAWLDLALAPIESVPEFEYRAREEEYIPFREASAGQQATALLWALLNQEGPPLIIDQPEDDLDSQIIV
jgi:chromosome segregation protein